MLKVNPVAGKLVSGGAFALRDLVFVMGKDQIDATGMDIKSLAEILHRHRRTLDVPAGPPTSEFGIPCGLIRTGSRLPQREVARVFFFVLVGIDAFAGPGDVAGKVDLRQLTVFRE